MTVKEIADKCGVSEQSIRAWCRRNNVAKVPQRQAGNEKKVAKPAYLITDEVAERICVYYAVYNNLKESEIEESNKANENEVSEVTEVSETIEISETSKTPESNETVETTLLSALQTQIDTLKQHNALLSEQLSIKDGQIAAQQEQIRTLTESLHDTTAALTAAQALHAGTIQQQLTEQQASSESVSEGVPVPEPKPERQGFWQRIFKKWS